MTEIKNYVAAHHIDVGYELWDRGYRVSRDLSEKRFVEIINLINQHEETALDFDTIFRILLITHAEWFVNEAEEAERYKAENEPKIREYFHEHFEGKTWEEIKGDQALYDCWGFYSDWHKDVYGYRPHAIVCGEYVRPY